MFVVYGPIKEVGHLDMAPASGHVPVLRVLFQGEYLREHVKLGYAVTVHSAEGAPPTQPWATDH